ncbi:hypothetical protein DYB32_000316 [Aphanomyces invadans]|uniref:SAM-dependent MTase RsmB/NOP-type domain-containing protein n=1 Tax=Aphanomyces invadans TaxID=157072 RepID=A0A3R6ZXI1_9STRA|nr:hypothetical protein DYB32_000316 [Aphanomyces invadans]
MHHACIPFRCAAPGSKTSQILETLTSSSDQRDGFVVANDASEKRGFLLVHQLLRLGLLSAVVTCHQGQDFPGLYDPISRQLQTTDAFDRVLCDVPCTGDGTLRKNENIWRHWHVGDGLTLHPFQLNIALRGAALLKVGGTMVYSTCSFNPIENEAVVAELIRRSDGALRLVEVALPGLKHRPGLASWQVGWQSKTKAKKQRHLSSAEPTKDELIAWYTSFSEDIPADLRGYRLTRSMFPPDDNSSVHLERCMRFLPHDQNTGGFFVAVLQKVAPLPGIDQQGLPAFEVNSALGPKCYRYVCRLCNQTGHYIQDCALSKKSLEKAAAAESAAASVGTPITVPSLGNSSSVSKHSHAVSGQEPLELVESVITDVTPIDDTAAGSLAPLPPSVWATLQDFYGLPTSFPTSQLFARSHGTGIVTYVSSSVQAACLAGPDLKVINTGVKLFMKFSTSHFKGYRPAQDGLELLIPFLGKRKVSLGWSAFHELVAITTTKFLDDLDTATKRLFDGMEVGPAVVVLQRQAASSNDVPPIGLAIWVGHTSLSKLVTTSDLTILADHLRSVDVSAYEP